MTQDRSGTTVVVASNRRARHDYSILDVFEAGIVLAGSEVKSLRLGQVQLADAYARVVDRELWLDGVHISPYARAQGFGAHVPDRPRKLLLHANEISRISVPHRAGAAHADPAELLLQGRQGEGRARARQRPHEGRQAPGVGRAGRRSGDADGDGPPAQGLTRTDRRTPTADAPGRPYPIGRVAPSVVVARQPKFEAGGGGGAVIRPPAGAAVIGVFALM